MSTFLLLLVLGCVETDSEATPDDSDVEDTDVEDTDDTDDTDADALVGTCTADHTTSSLVVDSSGPWVYVDLDTSAEVTASDGWDFRIQMWEVELNTGVEAAGIEGAYDEFDDRCLAPATLEGTALTGWYDYNGATHEISAHDVMYYVVTSEGAHQRLRFDGYAEGGGLHTPGFTHGEIDAPEVQWGVDREGIMTPESAATEVRSHLLTQSAATLCTLSGADRVEGFPFGSVVPFALTGEGLPVLFTASIAQHTKNLERDNRASLLVRQPGLDGDPQTGWRITLMGRWEPVSTDAPDREELEARYLQRVPSAVSYATQHRFGYWRMTTLERVRYIGGFGKIFWLSADQVLRDPQGEGVGKGASHAIDHMNDDHVEAMREMCAAAYGVSPSDVEMTGLDRTGLFIRAGGRLLYFPFDAEITGKTIRTEVVGLLKRCRGMASPAWAAK